MQPIHFATMSGHLPIIQLLIDEYGVDPNSKNEVSALYKFVSIIYRWYIINLSAASPATNSDGTNGEEMGSCWVVDREVWLQY